MKIHPVGAQLFHADGQTDRCDEANSCASQFCKVPKNGWQFNGLNSSYSNHDSFHGNHQYL